MGELRVTGGQWARRRVLVMRGAEQKGLRPTGDRVREALFSSLKSKGLLEDALVLDPFAGTGILGIEALSRGARGAFFCERYRPFVNEIEKSLATFRESPDFGDKQAKVFCGPAQKGIEEFAGHSVADLIFLDPPYDLQPTAELLAALEKALAPRGTLIFERRHGSPVEHEWGLSVQEVRRYGSTQMTFYQHPQSSTKDGEHG